MLPTLGSGGFGPRQRKEAEPSSVQDADFILPIKARKKTDTHTHTQTHGHTHPDTRTHTGTHMRESVQVFGLSHGLLTGHVATTCCANVPCPRNNTALQPGVASLGCRHLCSSPKWQTQTITGTFTSLSPITCERAKLFPNGEVYSGVEELS